MPGATSAIVVALNYGGTSPSGPIARYARGADYHDVMLDKLAALHRWIDQQTGAPVLGKAYVDTGPLLERDLARRAGLGWFGKNTNLLNPTLGSFFFLGTLLLDLDLEADAPFAADRCGSSTRCLDACPTDALIADRVLDATRCISYLTIEQRGPVPLELRELVGDLIYGCDICQDVCPWNVRFSRDLTESALAPLARPRRSGSSARCSDSRRMSSGKRFRRSPMTRAKRRGLARNAAVAIGNTGDAADVRALTTALATDPDPLVRGHAAWALGAIARRHSHTALEIGHALDAARTTEADATVIGEIDAARNAMHNGAANAITEQRRSDVMRS